MATIRDVAKLSGVSVATVSRVINSNGYVSKETKEKVDKAIKQLNFTPNHFARGLVYKKTNTIGLLVPDIKNPFFPEIAKAVEETALQKEYSIILSNTDHNFQKEKRYIQLLLEKSIDGIIITGEIHESNIEILVQNNIPIVVTDARVSDSQIPIVYTDNIEGGRRATHHLFDQGYTRVGHIKGPDHITTAEDRYSGYKLALEERNIEFDSTIVQWGDYQTLSGYEAMKRLLSMKHPPDAVFVANDLMALGALDAVRHSELKVPEDIGLVGFDGIPIIEVLQPRLTTIQQPFYEIGTLATKMLIEAIDGKKENTGQIILQSKLKVGQTSARNIYEKS